MITIDYRVDYELRRKIGNIIFVKIFALYHGKIYEIYSIEYLLGLSIEDIEKKFLKFRKGLIMQLKWLV